MFTSNSSFGVTTRYPIIRESIIPEIHKHSVNPQIRHSVNPLMLGWEPSLQFEEGIEKTVKWYLDNEDWLENVTSGDYKAYYEKMYGKR